MSTRKLPILLIALLIAGVTVFIARSMMTETEENAAVEAKAPPSYEILVAGHNLPAGTLLKESDMSWKKWPKDRDGNEYAIKGEKEKADFSGAVVRYGMNEGEPMLDSRTVRSGEQGFMAAALSPGMRAVSIAITPVAGVAGFVFPGDRIDVIVTHLIGQKSDINPMERRVSETMLQNVRVLALDQNMNSEVSEPVIAQIATLEVTPKQAETIALITELGTISLALRSIANDPEDKMKKAGQQANITWDSDVSRVLPRPANRTGAVQKVLIIRGNKATESLFDLQQP